MVRITEMQREQHVKVQPYLPAVVAEPEHNDQRNARFKQKVHRCADWEKQEERIKNKHKRVQ